MATRESAIASIKLFVADCKKIGLEFEKVLLFGSTAKNMAHKDSDIDLILVSDQFVHNIFDNLKLYSKVNIKYPLIETFPYSPANYAKDDFVNYIKDEAIEII